MELKEVGCDARNWMDHDEDRDQWRASVRTENIHINFEGQNKNKPNVN